MITINCKWVYCQYYYSIRLFDSYKTMQITDITREMFQSLNCNNWKNLCFSFQIDEKSKNIKTDFWDMQFFFVSLSIILVLTNNFYEYLSEAAHSSTFTGLCQKNKYQYRYVRYYIMGCTENHKPFVRVLNGYMYSLVWYCIIYVFALHEWSGKQWQLSIVCRIMYPPFL